MAKKKQKKDSEKKKFEYGNEILGILIILMSIVGIGNYGPAGNFIRSFSVFFVGTIYIFLLIYMLIVGAYLIVKRENPNFFSMKSIGFYIMVISLLDMSNLLVMGCSVRILLLHSSIRQKKKFFNA